MLLERSSPISLESEKAGHMIGYRLHPDLNISETLNTKEELPDFMWQGKIPWIAHRLLLGAAVLIGCLLAFAPNANARDTGFRTFHLKAAGTAMTVYAYRPLFCRHPSILFVFHGLHRKASKVRKKAANIARDACLVVLAPLFDKERFPNWRYHRAGVVYRGKPTPRSQWTAPILRGLIAAARDALNLPTAEIYLFGHSAGGQFLSRVSAYSPLPEIARIVIANPSVYVAPDLSTPAPYGFGGLFSPLKARQRLKAYLALPITLYLGQNDTGNKYLVRNDAAMRQGRHRLDRGRKIFRAAQRFAADKGWPFNWRLVEVPGVGHSSGGMLRAAAFYRALGIRARSLEPTWDKQQAG